MKKIIPILAVTLLMAACCVPVCAADTVNVTVTLWDGNGNAAVALQPLCVPDTDSDGIFSVADVLSAAHDEWYEGGAAAGYESMQTQWGLSLTRLWGDDSGSYGYYVNDQMAMSLSDTVSDGDYVAAFVYVDKEELSDSYAFVRHLPDMSSGGEECFLAQYVGWDEEWNAVTAPIVGANVYVDGMDSGVLTDSDGYARLSIGDIGDHLITVASPEKNYACGACRITVAASGDKAQELPATESVQTADETTRSAAPESETAAPQENAASQTVGVALTIAFLLAAAALIVVFVFKRHRG